MRISIIDLQCEDIMWFGINRNNCIFECTSAGCGNVPEFICKSKEETDELIYFFLDELDVITDEKILCEYDKPNQLMQDCISLAKKGIYCYDICEDEEHKNGYKKIVEPINPLYYDDLPQRIKEFMRGHKVDVDIKTQKYINIDHAY